MSLWPAAKTVAAGFKGHVAEVIQTPIGVGRGIRSGLPHVYLVLAQPVIVVCETCQEVLKAPDPPGSGAPGEPRNPLIAPGTRAHALFILTWLHKFAGEHRHDKVEVEDVPV